MAGITAGSDSGNKIWNEFCLGFLLTVIIIYVALLTMLSQTLYFTSHQLNDRPDGNTSADILYLGYMYECR